MSAISILLEGSLGTTAFLFKLIGQEAKMANQPVVAAYFEQQATIIDGIASANFLSALEIKKIIDFLSFFLPLFASSGAFWGCIWGHHKEGIFLCRHD